MTVLTAHPMAGLRVGMEAEQRRLCLTDDLFVFAHASGNLNPIHLPEYEVDAPLHDQAVAPSMWLGALISAVLGNQLPGPGTLYRRQDLRFLGRAHAGEEVVAKVRLTALTENTAIFETVVEGPDGRRLVEGEAEVTPPALAQTVDARDVPGLTVRTHRHFDRLLERAEPLPPIPCAVVAPEADHALGGALLGHDHTLIAPIMIGDQAKIEAVAAEIGRSLDGIEIIHEPSHSGAAARAVALVHEGRARALMKGHLHTDVLLKQVVKRDGGLRTDRRLSHVFVMDVPGLNHLLFVTDAAINISPDLVEKRDITQNAIDVARALGVEKPRAGVLAAVETVNPAMPSTLDAAALSKMSDRGQIVGGVVDGPLAMDNAIDMGAARTKGITGLVAGMADILVVPNIEAGNMVAKQLTFLAHAEAGGIVVGAKVPVILTSRADDDMSRLASCAVAALFAESL